ncbi:MAG: UvrD-helicase domain-containing protein, partial [Glaciimonas sp.]|nr:UvrD-helicase domain-containing protein [Glaciimonas sp.]
ARQVVLERGIAAHEIAASRPAARSLYERVLASPHSLSIDTFHSWFARLLQIAPLTSGVPHGYALTEKTGELLTDAYQRFMQSLSHKDNAELKQAMLNLYEQVGDFNALKLLNAFVGKRAEWWAATQNGEHQPLQWLTEMCGVDAEIDARLSLWDDQALSTRIKTIAWLLGHGTATNQKRATAIETNLSNGATLENFDAICYQFFDDNGKPRGNTKTNDLKKALENNFGADGVSTFDEEFSVTGEALKKLRRRSFERNVLTLNENLFIAGNAYLEAYQTIKAEQRVLDFADLEWQAYRLLTNPESAAYVQSRLDTRYKHILLDEFQDTNPLQWSIVRAWLNAYGDDAGQPSVFVVGDPKQSIYRFRRSEPRVFMAARDMLQQQGATVLQANQTRRNATAIVEVLNASFTGNPLFSAQTTLGENGGAVWRLPLIQSPEMAQAQEQTARNPLTTARDEEENARRLDEGHAIAQSLLQAKRTLRIQQGDGTRVACWSDIMILVKKRTHLNAYEAALRSAQIPFMSDRRGGLLESLEISDLIALLTFLIMSDDARALAHVLKSPIFSVSDEALIMLAQREECGWWARLKAAAKDEESLPALQRAATLLAQWLALAPRIAVHDLLDVILHQGQLLERYAKSATALTRDQATGNIQAFIELALNMDAGRYPSLPKFIAALRTLQSTAESDAPDEASITAATDAVRILTVHSAKGLEAPVIVMVDANHSDPARDDIGILCDWPQDADAPVHFSAFGRNAERGTRRDTMFITEEENKEQEDWNLLYVAMTRAKQLLIVSGVADERARGVKDGSWYARLLAVPEMQLDVDTDVIAPEKSEQNYFDLAVFDPPAMPLVPLTALDGMAEAPRSFNNAAIDEGIALHALLERLTQQNTQKNSWPIIVPDAATIARWLPCSFALAEIVQQQAQTILTQPSLAHFFDPALHVVAHNEMEIITDATLLRFDRIVIFEHEVWILDYKRQLLDSERAAYQAQLAGYRAAAKDIFFDKVLKTAVITADGMLIEIG